MQTLAALRLMVRHHPLGLDGIALELAKSADVVRLELGNTSPKHKAGVISADMIQAACVRLQSPHCYAYASAVASDAGGRFELPAGAAAKDAKAPMQRVCDLMRETSDVANTVMEAMADGVVSDNELTRIEREISEAEEVLRRMRACARETHAKGRPSAACGGAR